MKCVETGTRSYHKTVSVGILQGRLLLGTQS